MKRFIGQKYQRKEKSARDGLERNYKVIASFYILLWLLLFELNLILFSRTSIVSLN